MHFRSQNLALVFPSLVFMSLALYTPVTAQPCPANLVTMGGVLGSMTTAALFDTVAAQGRVNWDMTAGRVYMYSSGWLAGPTVAAFDDFDVTGVAAGTPVSVIAELTVDGAVWTSGCGGSGCGGLYSVTFVHGADSLVVLHSDHLFSGRLDHHDVLQLPFMITAGQPERIEIRAHGQRTPGGAHESEANCILSFAGLDAGLGVTSCKGFAGAVVPALPTSWGRLKAMYR